MVKRRRKKSARSVDGDDSGNFNIKLNLFEARSLVRYREVSGIPGIYIRGSLQASRWGGGGGGGGGWSSELQLK